MGSCFELQMRALSDPAGPGLTHFWTFRCPRGRSTDRPPIGSEPNNALPQLFALFDAVVAGSTEALEVVGIEEQRLITFMWPDMVTHRCWRDVLLLQAVGTQWMCSQLPFTQTLPSCCLVKLAVSGCFRAATVGSGHAYLRTGALAGDRTPDHPLTRRLLSHLSYTGDWLRASGSNRSYPAYETGEHTSALARLI